MIQETSAREYLKDKSLLPARLLFLAMAVPLVGILLISTVYYLPVAWMNIRSTGKAAFVLSSTSRSALDDYHLVSVPTSFSSIVAGARSAVVSIHTATTVGSARLMSPFGEDSIGSGVIVDPGGLIITNEHEVSGLARVMISIPSVSSDLYPARVINADSLKDLALLKVEVPMSLPSVKLGDSAKIEIGDIVFAIGAPFRFEQTVTMGIVSSVGRDLTIEGREYQDLIQTDAAINTGSGGGCLVNASGEVIGVCTAILAPTEVWNGISFAIPINQTSNLLANSAFSY